MIVVADTSPLNYLLQIDCESVLPALHKQVVVPSSVLSELAHPGAPAIIKTWVSRLPDWIIVHSAISQPDSALAFLDPGEQDAILLAQEMHADLLLIDERRGRAEARRRGLATTGTLGVLLAAARNRLTDPATAFERLLTKTNFRCTPEVQNAFLQSIRLLPREKK